MSNAKGEIGQVEVRTSEASRRDARPVSHEVETALEEYERLYQDQMSIQAQLSDFKNVLLTEQCRIRRHGSDSSTLYAWLKRKSQLHEERDDLKVRLKSILARRAEIKFRASEERAVRNSLSIVSVQPGEQLKQAQLVELRGIRDLLQELVDEIRTRPI